MSVWSFLCGAKDFFELVKAIGESKSKQEEDRIITHEVQTLKTLVCGKQVSGVSHLWRLVGACLCRLDETAAVPPLSGPAARCFDTSSLR